MNTTERIEQLENEVRELKAALKVNGECEDWGECEEITVETATRHKHEKPHDIFHELLFQSQREIDKELENICFKHEGILARKLSLEIFTQTRSLIYNFGEKSFLEGFSKANNIAHTDVEKHLKIAFSDNFNCMESYSGDRKASLYWLADYFDII